MIILLHYFFFFQNFNEKLESEKKIVDEMEINLYGGQNAKRRACFSTIFRFASTDIRVCRLFRFLGKNALSCLNLQPIKILECHGKSSRRRAIELKSHVEDFVFR